MSRAEFLQKLPADFDRVRALPAGAQRCANVEQFLHLAERFDQFQRQGLFRLLKFIAAQQTADSEPAVAAENAVRLMSIHQSKGLEFLVVAVADLAKHFNEQDLRGEALRLLYVALTRARDTLILAANVSENKWETLWTKPGEVTSQKIVAAKSFADWIGLWFANQFQSPKRSAG